MGTDPADPPEPTKPTLVYDEVEGAYPGLAEDGDRTPRLAKKAVRRSISDGVEIIQDQVRILPQAPGVYRMLDGGGEALYVGKARNLARRVNNYTQIAKQPSRLLRMIAETVSMEVVVTASEVEALLLEANLIKRLRPRYNVLLRDDKTFPHILLTGDHAFPQLTKHRGAEKRKGSYFGPFASAGAVNRTITALQKAFLLRNCTDAIFNQRTRPCLQYQIKRCTAPCVGYVTDAEYGEQVAEAVGFLKGTSTEAQTKLRKEMETAAAELDYERAARYRDRIRALANIQAHQDINVEGIGDADAFAVHQTGGQTCIQVYFFRGDRNYGTKSYFPSADKQLDPGDVLAAFIGQFYDNKRAPRSVLISVDLEEADLIAEALSIRAEHKVTVAHPQRGDKKRLMEHALQNAREALGRRLAESSSQRRLLDGVAEIFDLPAPPNRIEVYDNSHTRGTDAVGAMIVAGPEGFDKQAYRKFNIKLSGQAVDGDAVAGGDDYAMMREVFTRRFKRALKEDPDREQGTWPDLVLIDGGKGQLSTVMEVMAELGIDDVPLVGVAKGPDRDAGRERFFQPGKDSFLLDPRHAVLYFLQRLRDEAHRFAIGSHRARRGQSVTRSPIDDIPGIGPKRKRALLLHFGSGRTVARAGLADLEAVEGISKAVAQKIYDHFHTQS